MLYKRTITQRLLAILLAITMMIGLIPQSAFATSSGGVTNSEMTTAEMQAVADADSRYTYQDIFDDVTVGKDTETNTDIVTFSTQNSGRIWADKSVSTDSMTFKGDLHFPNESETATGTNERTIDKEGSADFQVAYSLMGNISTTVTKSDAPMDVVLMLDFSPQSNSEKGKVDTMLNAVEGAVNEILAANPNNRVAIVGYSTQAETLLPLGHYETVDLEYSGAATQRSTVKCTYTPSNSESGDEGTDGSPREFTIAANGGGMNKYTQQGIYAGMNILKQAFGTDLSNRQPVMILLSEGEPKIASTNITTPSQSSVPVEGLSDGTEEGQYSNTIAYKTEPSSNSGNRGSGVEIIRNYNITDKAAGTNNEPLSAWNNRHAQTFATLLTAAYAKNQVTDHYFSNTDSNDTAKSEQKALFYTVGIRTNSANSPDLAKIVLDPAEYLNEGSAAATNNPLSDDFIGYAKDYFNGKSVALIDAGKTDNNTAHTIEFNKSEIGTLEGVTSFDDLRYNDMFFNATATNNGVIDFGTIFEDILTNIATEQVQGTTHISEGENSVQGGYVTYTDPLGDYMEVKRVDALIHSNIIFTNPKEKMTEDSEKETTTYTFSGVANNPVYGSYSVSNIIITVETDKETGRQTLTVKVPAALIPLREATVHLDKTGESTQITSYTQGRTFPMRLVYSVGVKNDVLEKSADETTNGEKKIDATKIDNEYLKNHYDEATKTITFNQGQYSEEKVSETDDKVEGKSYGDAYVTYVPSANNPFYYLTENTAIYKTKSDQTCSNPLQASDTIQADETYYFQVPYYVHTQNENGSDFHNEVKQDIIERSGSQLHKDYLTTVGDNRYLVKGTPRMSSLIQYTTLKGADTADSEVTTKNANASGTADIRMYPTYQKFNPEEHSLPGNIEFRLYLGNNGKLTVPVAEGFNVPESAVLKDLTINKVVTGDWPEGERFQFKIEAETDDAPMPEKDTITIAKDGDNEASAHFGNITFNKVGTYEYKITEQKGANENITYDGRTLTVTVEVKENEEGNLEATATFADDDNKDNTDPKTFYNTIQQQSNEIPGGSEEPGDQPSTDDPDTPEHNPGTPGGTTPEQPGDEPGDTPSEPEQPLDPDGPDDLNTVDHFYYIVGYPEDYRTGAVTDDESLWPIKPQGKITRAEVATIFYRLLKKDVREANTTTQNNFSDVSADDWYGTTVSTLAHMGIIAGYEDGSFRPNAPITRAEFAAIAARFFENTDVDYPAGLFTDIAGDEWYADIVAAAAELGLIGGYPDGTMRPLATISRAEACAIVNRTIERHPDEDHLADSADMRTWPDNLPGAWYYADMQEATNGHEYTWLNDEHTSEEWTEVIPDFDWSKR